MPPDSSSVSYFILRPSSGTISHASTAFFDPGPAFRNLQPVVQRRVLASSEVLLLTDEELLDLSRAGGTKSEACEQEAAVKIRMNGVLPLMQALANV